MENKSINNVVLKTHPIIIPFYLLQSDHYENIKKQAKNKDNKDTIVGFLNSAQNITNPPKATPRYYDTVHYRDISSSVSVILDFLEDKGFLEKLCRTGFERFTCHTSGLKIVQIPRDGVRTLASVLQNIRSSVEDKGPLDELIKLFRFRDNKKRGIEKTIIYVDPIKTPKDVFKRLY